MQYEIRTYKEDDYVPVVELLAQTYQEYYTKAFKTEEKLVDFLLDLEIIPKFQPEGFYVAIDNHQIVGAICLRWKEIRYGSSLGLLHKSVKYRHPKVYRRMLGATIFDHDIDADECHIDHFILSQSLDTPEVATLLLDRAESYAFESRFKRFTAIIPSNTPLIEYALRSVGFKTRKIHNSRILKYFLGDSSRRFMVKTPGFKQHQLTIGMFTDTYMPQINGVATSINILTRELEKMGHKVYIITIRDKATSLHFDGKILRIPGFRVLRGTDYRLANIIMTPPVAKIVREMNLDIVHTHTEFAIGLLGTYVSKFQHIPQVHTYHTMYDDYIHYTTNFKPFQRIALSVVRNYVKDFTDECNKVFVPTEKTKDVLHEYQVTAEMVTIPTGIDFSKFIIDESHEQVVTLKEQLGYTDQDFVCLNIGRVSKEKNVEVIIDNVISLIPDYPQIKLVIIGDGPDYKRLVEKTSNYRDNIRFLGRVPWEQIGYYYKLGDAFVVASRFETQGLTIIEALSSGLPVVCPDDQAFLNVVEDGMNGLIFHEDGQIKDKILQLMNEETYEHILSNTANSVVKYSSEYFVETVQNEYLSLL